MLTGKLLEQLNVTNNNSGITTLTNWLYAYQTFHMESVIILLSFCIKGPTLTNNFYTLFICH